MCVFFGNLRGRIGSQTKRVDDGVQIPVVCFCFGFFDISRNGNIDMHRNRNKEIFTSAISQK